MRIIQVLDYYASGNAVANCAVTYHKFSERLGYTSRIVARLIDKWDENVEDLSYLDDISETDVIMYHLCIGTPLNNDICNYRCKKILVYHNITPPALIEKYSVGIADACAEGLRQLKEMRPFFELCLADSEFNKQDLIKAGYDAGKIVVIPPYVSRTDFTATPDAATMQRYGDGWTNILFVGRVSPNKKHEDLIRIFAYYKKNVNPKSRLILAGGIMENYYERLLTYVKELGVEDVVFTKQISFSRLLAFYRTASVFLCTSEHEGYCIPLIEAMIFNIPVIGYDAGAVGDTMGGSGILLDNKSPVLVSKVIDTLEKDKELREHIIKRQNAYLETLTQEAVFERYQAWVEDLPRNLAACCFEQNETIAVREGSNPYDVVIVIKAADWDMAKINLEYIRKNLNPKRIVIISSDKIKRYLRPEDQVVFINEDELYPHMNFRGIKEFFVSRNMAPSLTGWFLQQFLKLAYAFVCEDSYYLTWDADTVPLNPVSMFDEQTKKPCFDMKPEFVAPYFNTLENLLGLKKQEEESYIAEHMLFSVEIVKHLIFQIENNDTIPGKYFYEKILSASDFSKQGNAFSEFETYGTFCDYYYPDAYKKRHTKAFRAGKMFLGQNPSQEILDWAAADTDIISFEHPQKVIEKAEKMARNKRFRNTYSFSEFVTRIHLSDVMNKNEWLEEENAALKMDYPWVDKPLYVSSEEYRTLQESGKKYSHNTVMVYMYDEVSVLLGLYLAHMGCQVVVYGSAELFCKIAAQNYFWGLWAMQQNMKKQIIFTDQVLEQKEFTFAFIPDCKAEEILKSIAKNLVEIKNTVIVGNAFQKEEVNALSDKISRGTIINTVLLKRDALIEGRQSVICVPDSDKEAVYDLQKLLGRGFKIKKIRDSEEFYRISEKLAAYMQKKEALKKQLQFDSDIETARILTEAKVD